MTQHVPDTVTFDPTSLEFQQDPYPIYRRLREADPVHRHGDTHWLLTRYHDCLPVLDDLRFRTLENIRCHSDESVRGKPEGPEAIYVLYRKAVTRAVTPATVRKLQPMIQRVVDELLDEALEAGRVDIMETFCYALATAVFCEIFGIPPSDRGLLGEWMEPIVEGLDDAPVGVSAETAERRDRARAEMSDYLRSLAAARRSQLRDDLISDFVRIDLDSRRMTDTEIAEASIILLLAGHETSASLIGNATLTLLRHPAELQRLRDDPAMWPLAIEELLRYVPPAQVLIRQASVDLDVNGHRIPEGDIVVVSLAAANRDPEVFHDPERLDLSRDPNPHISFGRGPHYCLGSTLARAESIIALRTLVTRAPELSLVESPRYRPTLIRRALDSLWVDLR